ncbi:aldehyde dehydrogenase [Exidia glandulosa HHB12029]|uniref:Aldehyde dehydrogenase n=1 Tax=Exidia glandulosa HHB12029 TaxID=1314781 RepID=A0A166AJ46_EXIGL|nr:aldehyde dehydrogenase [Exidia glandulosa HHB12029]
MATLNLLAEPVVPCFVAGKILATSKTYPLVDPHSGQHLYDVSAASVQDALSAVEAASAALPAWKATSLMDRRAIFLRAATILRERTAELAELEFRETTSSGGWSGFEMGLALEVIEELAAASTALRGEIAPSHAGQRAYLTRVPYGVVFAMAPWNAPMTLGTRSVANPIMAGNTCVLKTSEFSPKVHTSIAQIFLEAGLPAGVLNVVHVDPKDAPAVAEAVIAHPAVRKVNFTGSTRVGRIIAEMCGRHLKPSTLELGGAAPFVVLADADLDFAANAALFGGFFHSGQVCMSTNTVIVHESVAESFCQRLQAHLPTMKAEANSPALRGVFSTTSAQRLDTLVDDALDKGAKILTGTRHVENNLVQPLVLTGINKDMRIFHEEIFGPIITVVTFKTDEEAIATANATEYGLAAAVYGKDTSNAYKIASQIEAGMVHINGATIHDAQQMPHGGVKSSGWGRFNGLEGSPFCLPCRSPPISDISCSGLKEFTQIKTITINDPHKFPV